MGPGAASLSPTPQQGQAEARLSRRRPSPQNRTVLCPASLKGLLQWRTPLNARRAPCARPPHCCAATATEGVRGAGGGRRAGAGRSGVEKAGATGAGAGAIGGPAADGAAQQGLERWWLRRFQKLDEAINSCEQTIVHLFGKAEAVDHPLEAVGDSAAGAGIDVGLHRPDSPQHPTSCRC